MRAFFLTVTVLIVTAIAPASGMGLILDTGTPINGVGSVTSYVNVDLSIAMQIVPEYDYRVESAAVYLAGRGQFVMLISQADSVNSFPNQDSLVSCGSFQRPYSWDWHEAWCDFDLQDFIMEKGMTYWLQYTNPYPETVNNWLGVRLIESESYRRADWRDSSWQWPTGYYEYPHYIPATRLYGSIVPELPPLSVVAAGLICTPLFSAFRCRKRG